MLEINYLKSNRLLLTRYVIKLYMRVLAVVLFLRKNNLLIRICCLKWLQGFCRKSWRDIFHSF